MVIRVAPNPQTTLNWPNNRLLRLIHIPEVHPTYRISTNAPIKEAARKIQNNFKDLCSVSVNSFLTLVIVRLIYFFIGMVYLSELFSYCVLDTIWSIIIEGIRQDVKLMMIYACNGYWWKCCHYYKREKNGICFLRRL